MPARRVPRKHATGSRKREDRLLRLEHAVSGVLAGASEPLAAAREVMRAICETEGWSCGRFFRLDEAARVMRYAAGWAAEGSRFDGFLARSVDLQFAYGQGLVGAAWRSGEALWIEDASKDARVTHRRLAQDHGVHSGLVFPLVAQGRTHGVIAISSDSIREPDRRLHGAIGAIGSQLGLLMQRCQAEEAMRASERRLRAIVHNEPQCVKVLDGEGRLVDMNPAGLRMIEADDIESLRGKHVYGLVAPEDRAAFRDLTRRVAGGGEGGLEFRMIGLKGATRWLETRAVPLPGDNGGNPMVLGITRDITERRRAEAALRESEARFRALTELSSDWYWEQDAELRFVSTGGRSDARGGITPDAHVGLRRWELPRTQIVGQTWDEHRRVLEARQPFHELVLRREGTNGEVHYVSVDGRPFFHADGRFAGYHGVAKDVTERFRAEQHQATHLRRQERIASFGQSALARREPAELVDEAVQTVLAALRADAVAYLERGPGAAELVVRALVGVAGSGAESGTLSCAPSDPLLMAVDMARRLVVDGAELPLAWARPLRSAALMPVQGEGATRGLLCALFRQPGAIGADELNFADAVASVLSTGLQRIDGERRLAYLAQFDPLTGLPNRALLADRFSQLIVQAQRHASPLAVLFVDLDEFKLVNDTLGHAAGDELLKEVARRLQSAVRSGDTVARISGDEFAVVLANLARSEDAALVAQKVLEALAAPVVLHDKETFVTASVGIAAFPADGADAESLIGAADAAMYRAKQAGRNAYHFFTAEINQRTRVRAQMGSELRRAFEREEFALAYQPKYELSSRKVSGAEALLRWKHPERGMVPPVEFIPVLEEIGLIVPVGEWVLRRACEDMKAWQAAGLTFGPVSVNLSARQFRQQDLDARFRAVIAAAGVDTSLIELEITESQLMQDPDYAIRVMRSMRDAGVRLAIDDFGTGYSSLAYLTRFPVHALKVDRSFVHGMSGEKGDATIVRTIIEMAHTLGFGVVAEGVETEQQAAFLRLLRCEQAQGYLFARPMPAADLLRLLAKP